MMKHDAYWCPKCDVWLEKGCTDPACEFCADRPAKPSMVEDKRSWDWSDKKEDEVPEAKASTGD